MAEDEYDDEGRRVDYELRLRESLFYALRKEFVGTDEELWREVGALIAWARDRRVREDDE